MKYTQRISLSFVVVCIIFIIFLALFLAARPTVIQDTIGTTRIQFAADHRMVLPGICVPLRWTVEGAQQVSLDDQAAASHGTVEICPVATNTYTLLVTGVDGTQKKLGVVVGVYLSTASTRYLTAAIIAFIVFIIFLVALVGDLPLLTPILAAPRKNLLRLLTQLRTGLQFRSYTRDLRYIVILFVASAVKFIALRNASWAHYPLIEIISWSFLMGIAIFWLRTGRASLPEKTADKTLLKKSTVAFRALGICGVLLTCAIISFYLPMRSQFWMGGDEVRVLKDGIDGWPAIARYDSLYNRPFTPIASIVAAQFTESVDGYLWVALILRFLSAICVFGIVYLLAGEDALALAAAALFMVNPSEPARFLAIYMQGYNTVVLGALASLALFVYSHKRIHRGLLFISCVLLGASLTLVEAVFLVCLLWPAIILWKGAHKSHTGVWLSAWLATVILCVTRIIYFQIMNPSNYMGSLLPSSFRINIIFSNFLQQLAATLALLQFHPALTEHWLAGVVAGLACFAGLWAVGHSRTLSSSQYIKLALGASIAIVLAVALYVPIDGVLAHIRTQFLPAPAQAVLWAAGIAWAATWLPGKFRRATMAIITCLVVTTTTAGAFEEQARRPVNPAVTYEKTTHIVRQVLDIAPAVKPNTTLLFVYDLEPETPLGWQYYIAELSRYILGADGSQVGHTDSLGNGYTLSPKGLLAFYAWAVAVPYDQLIAFEIDASGTVKLLQKLPASILPKEANASDLYNPNARIISQAPKYPRFF